jgi:hypothetical protein
MGQKSKSGRAARVAYAAITASGAATAGAGSGGSGGRERGDARRRVDLERGEDLALGLAQRSGVPAGPVRVMRRRRWSSSATRRQVMLVWFQFTLD